MSDVAQPQIVLQRLRQHETDTGSPQVQIVLLTDRINRLAEHFQTHKRDHNSRHGLLKMVGRRRSLLEYLKRNDEPTYRKVLESLNLRK